MRFWAFLFAVVFWASGALASLGPADAENTGPQEERIFYFYHPDHLGSSSYVTDIDGLVFQHVEYFPFGETWVEEHSNRQRTPYLFTGKEFDEDVQLYYFGARYYDPRTSVWQSPDPILAEYLTGQSSGDGVYTPRNLNLYSYSHMRPISMTDLDGEETYVASRDLATNWTFVGSHSLLVTVTNDPKQYGDHASNFRRYTNNSGGQLFGYASRENFYAMTTAGHQRDGNLVKLNNESADVRSLEELADGRTTWLITYNLDVAGPALDDGNAQTSVLDLDLAILGEADAFDNTAYGAFSRDSTSSYNCNAFSNTVSKRAGVTNFPSSGWFGLPGLDPGSRDVIPEQYFLKPEVQE